jgi:hypothetical protein
MDSGKRFRIASDYLYPAAWKLGGAVVKSAWELSKLKARLAVNQTMQSAHEAIPGIINHSVAICSGIRIVGNLLLFGSGVRYTTWQRSGVGVISLITNMTGIVLAKGADKASETQRQWLESPRPENHSQQLREIKTAVTTRTRDNMETVQGFCFIPCNVLGIWSGLASGRPLETLTFAACLIGNDYQTKSGIWDRYVSKFFSRRKTAADTAVHFNPRAAEEATEQWGTFSRRMTRAAMGIYYTTTFTFGASGLLANDYWAAGAAGAWATAHGIRYIANHNPEELAAKKSELQIAIKEKRQHLRQSFGAWRDRNRALSIVR